MDIVIFILNYFLTNLFACISHILSKKYFPKNFISKSLYFLISKYKYL